MEEVVTQLTTVIGNMVFTKLWQYIERKSFLLAQIGLINAIKFSILIFRAPFKFIQCMTIDIS